MPTPNINTPTPAQYVQLGDNLGHLIFSGPGIFYGIGTVTAGTTWTVTVYDNTAASGTQIIAAGTAIVAGQLLSGVPAVVGVECKNGLYVAFAGGAPAGTANVFYNSQNP
jgi:hypothetical protein